MFSFDSLTEGEGHQLRSDLRVALIGGGAAALVLTVIEIAVGRTNGWEAQALLNAGLPTIRFLCSSLMTASATTLALMLTLLSLSSGSDREIKRAHFERIRLIAFVDVVAFIGATILLSMLIVPFSEASDIQLKWYEAIYYVVTVASAMLSGLVVAVMLLLYAAVRDMITTIGPGDESPLLVDEESAEEAQAEAERSEAEADRSESEADRSEEAAEEAAEEAEEAAEEGGDTTSGP